MIIVTKNTAKNSIKFDAGVVAFCSSYSVILIDTVAWVGSLISVSFFIAISSAKF